jgi:hypothetical protein
MKCASNRQKEEEVVAAEKLVFFRIRAAEKLWRCGESIDSWSADWSKHERIATAMQAGLKEAGLPGTGRMIFRFVG